MAVARVHGWRRVPAPSLTTSWQRQSWPLRILRAFLGITFVYAGIQKLADPNFLHAGTPDYIGTQLHGFARGSPVAPLLTILSHAPVLTGVAIALTETAIGLATLLGVAPIIASASGFAVNLVLFLSATWHVHPYFLGSDSMYAVGWAAYLAGEVEVQARAARAMSLRGSRRSRMAAREEMGRREFLRGALVGLGTLVLGATAGVLAGKPSSADSLGSLPSPTRIRKASPNPHRSKSPAASQPTGTPIASLDSVPVGQAVGFSDPQQGPGVLVRVSQDEVAAFSRVCTHAGCLVGYDSGSRLLVCPCHGAEFDPSRGAEPVAGPAPTPLAPIKVALDRASGKIVATS